VDATYSLLFDGTLGDLHRLCDERDTTAGVDDL
jgi:hypothetical protein